MRSFAHTFSFYCKPVFYRCLQSGPWEHGQVPLRTIWITVTVFCGHTLLQPVSKSDYIHLCNSFSMSIHCKTDMLLILVPQAKICFLFAHLCISTLFICLFSFFPLIHTHTHEIQFHSKQHTNKSNQKCTRAGRKTHMCTRTLKLTPLLFINPQVHTHAHTHTHSMPPVGHTYVFTHMQTHPTL